MIPTVSVVITAHNEERFIRRAIRSVLEQTLQDFELIAVDDGSMDGTWTIISEFARRDPRIHEIHHPSPLGHGAARNAALRISRADYVAILDADDAFEPSKLSVQAKFMRENPAIGYCGTWYREVTPGGKQIRTVTPPTQNEEIRSALLRYNPFCHSTVMVRRDVLDLAGHFDETLAASEDVDLAWRCGSRAGYAILPEVLTLHTRDWERDVRIYRMRQVEKVRVRLRWYRRTRAAAWTYLLVLPDVAALLLPASLSARFRSRASRRPHRDLARAGRATTDRG